MSHHDWQDVALALIAALPAIIAAISSIRNGTAIEKHDHDIKALNGKNSGLAGESQSAEKPASSNGADADWYRPPKL